MSEEFIYYGSIVLASCFAGLSQIFTKKDENGKIEKLNKFFWLLSFVVLLIMMGFRKCGVGVDDFQYQLMFNSVSQRGVINEFIMTTVEPGYLLLNYIISIFTNDFQVVIFITTLIPLFLYYKALEYEKNNINLFLGVFLFGTMLFLYFFGITRLFIAASIIAFAFRYIVEKKTFKYIICVLIAISFHYSAFIMIFLIMFSLEKEDKKISITTIVSVVSIALPVILIIVFVYIFPNMGDRYSNYTIINRGIDIGTFDKVPIVLLAVIFFGTINKFNDKIRIYITIYLLATVISIYNTWFEIGRIQWYCNFAVCIILPSVVRAFKKLKYVQLNFISIPAFITYAVMYSYRIVFIQVTNICMTNYYNILIK